MNSRIVVIFIGALSLVLAGAFVALASAPLAPHPQTIEKPIPDDRIPH